MARPFTARMTPSSSPTADDPSQVGLYATSTDFFSVTSGGSTVTFKTMMMEAKIYLASTPPTFSLTFEELTGTAKTDPFTSLSALLDPDVESWIAEVMLRGSYWLNLYVGSSNVTVGQVLVAAHFLTQDADGNYNLSLTSLKDQTRAPDRAQLRLCRPARPLDTRCAAVGAARRRYLHRQRSTGDRRLRRALRSRSRDATATTTNGKAPQALTCRWVRGSPARPMPRVGWPESLARRPRPGSRCSCSDGTRNQASQLRAELRACQRRHQHQGQQRCAACQPGWLHHPGRRATRLPRVAGLGLRIRHADRQRRFPARAGLSEAQNGSGSENVVAKNLIASDGQTSNGGRRTPSTRPSRPRPVPSRGTRRYSPCMTRRASRPI